MGKLIVLGGKLIVLGTNLSFQWQTCRFRDKSIVLETEVSFCRRCYRFKDVIVPETIFVSLDVNTMVDFSLVLGTYGLCLVFFRFFFPPEHKTVIKIWLIIVSVYRCFGNISLSGMLTL